MKKQAIGVGRFSSEQQEAGDSRVRQQRAFERVCRSMDLEVVGYLFDNGKSAYKGEHLSPDSEFGAFLMKVRAGEQKPCLLVWEMVDRFSRMGGRKTTAVAELLINAGFSLYFDDEELLIDADNIDDKWGEFQKHLEAAFKFSRRLSKRMKAARQSKREAGVNAVNTRHNKGSKSAACPKWLKPAGASYVENEFADVVREMFRLSLEGMGAKQIHAKLKLGKVDVLGFLRNRTVIGEYQPMRRIDKNRREENGPAISGYYPAIVDETTFLRVQRELDSRRKQRGRKGKFVTNLFKELFWGSDGEKMYIKGESSGRKMLTRRTPGKLRSFDYNAIESGILTELRDVSLTPSGAALAKDYDAILADLARRLNELKELQAEFPSRANAEAMAKLERQEDEVKAERDREKGKIAPPVALTECKNLINELVGKTGDELLETRTRIAGCIARLIGRVDVTVAKDVTGNTACEVKLTFVNGTVRRFSVVNVGRKVASYVYVGMCGAEGKPIRTGDKVCFASASVG